MKTMICYSKISICCISILFFTQAISAQDTRNDFRDRTQFGFKAGLNVSNAYDIKDQSFITESKPGLAAGLFLRLPVAKWIGFQPEVLLSQKGFYASGNLEGNTYELKRTGNFVDVPLFFTVRPAGFISIMAGPQLSALIKQKSIFTSGTITDGQKQYLSDYHVRKNTLSFSAGADINIKHLVLSARAGWDLQSNYSAPTASAPRYKNRWYQFTLGYRLYYYQPKN